MPQSRFSERPPHPPSLPRYFAAALHAFAHTTDHCASIACTMAASSREPPPDVIPDEVDSTDSEDEEDPAAPGCGADEEWEEWQDDDGDGEAEPACSLFDATVLPSPLAAMDYDSRTHAFDLKRFIEQVRAGTESILIRPASLLPAETRALSRPRRPGAHYPRRAALQLSHP